MSLGPDAFSQEHSGHGAPKKNAAPAKQPAPAPSITLSPEKRQLIGVRTAAAGMQNLGRHIRTVGKIDVDETRLAFVNTKVSGWVRKLFVDYTGKEVKKGQPLLSLYSPDLVTAQEEYLLALQQIKAGGGAGGIQEIGESQRSLLESARRRLLLWDITQEQIADLEKTGKPHTEMLIYAPLDGVVLEKMVLEGAFITSGMNLYKIADLSDIWLIADVYEYEVSSVAIGQKASVTLAYAPGTVHTATVSYIYPTLDPLTRTVKVRLVMKNPGLLLKPEMFANVEIRVSSGMRLAILREAVLDSGIRKIVYVETKPGTYEMRTVRLGIQGDRYVEVLSGIRKGERVVTSGNFLIDSESQLRTGQ